MVWSGSAAASLVVVAMAQLPESPVMRLLVIGVLALVALYLMVSAARCALRLVGLALLAAGAFLAWRWLA